MVINMDTGNFFMRMEIDMRGIGKLGRELDMVNFIIMMVHYMMGYGIKEVLRVKV